MSAERYMLIQICSYLPLGNLEEGLAEKLAFNCVLQIDEFQVKINQKKT